MKPVTPKPARGFTPNKNPRSGLSITENLTMKEIEEDEGVNKRIAKIIEYLISEVKDTYEGKSGNIALNISASFVHDVSAKKTEEIVEHVNDEDVVPGLEEAFTKHQEKRQRINAELTQKIRKLRQSKSTAANVISSGAENSVIIAKNLNPESVEAVNKISKTGASMKALKRKHSKSESEIHTRKSGNFSQTFGLAENDIAKTPINMNKNKQHASPIKKTPELKNNQLNASLKSSKKKKNKTPKLKESEDYLPLSV